MNAPWVAPVLPHHMSRGFGAKVGRPKLDSRFILDVNVMDGTTMAPSTSFTKIWRMRNNGSLLWPKGTQLVWIGGDRFSDAISLEIEVSVAIFENIIVVLIMFMPDIESDVYLKMWVSFSDLPSRSVARSPQMVCLWIRSLTLQLTSLHPHLLVDTVHTGGWHHPPVKSLDNVFGFLSR